MVLTKGVVELMGEDTVFDIKRGIVTAGKEKLALVPVPKEKLVVLESANMNVDTGGVITGGTASWLSGAS